MNIKKFNEEFLKTPINEDILKKVTKEFLKQSNDLLNSDLNTCIFNNKEAIKKALFYTYDSIIMSIKTNRDLINLFNFNMNSKTDGIIGINYKPYLLCRSMLEGNCNISHLCYSSKFELAYNYNEDGEPVYNSLINTLKNFILFYYCIYSGSNKLIYEGIKKELKYNTYYFKKYDILRFNIKADIDNIEVLLLFNSIHKFIMRLFNKEAFISYTYSKSSFLKDFNKWELLHPNFIINKSYGLVINNKELETIINKDNNHNKGYITLLKNYEYEPELLKKINKCSYLNGSMCVRCRVACHNKDSLKLNYTYLH